MYGQGKFRWIYENKFGKIYENMENEIRRSKSQTKWILIAAMSRLYYQLIGSGRSIFKISFFMEFLNGYTSHTLFSEINVFENVDVNFN